MKTLAFSILGVSAVGAVRATQRGRPCRFLGIPFPGAPWQHALTVGSPMSAPPIMLATLVVAVRRGRSDIVGLLSTVFIAGILSEPDTWATFRRPRFDPVSTVCVALEIVLPAALLRKTLRGDAVQAPRT